MKVPELKAVEYTCPICGRKYDRYKGLHGHMMMAHRSEFEEKGRTLSAYGIYFDPHEKIIRELYKIERAVTGPEEVRRNGRK